MSERNQEIYRKRKAGATYTEMARHYKLSAVRVRQIVFRTARLLGEPLPYVLDCPGMLACRKDSKQMTGALFQTGGRWG